MSGKRGDASFIVRIWWEGRNQGTKAPVWRGQVQHAVSGEATGFRDMGELWGFFQRWTGAQTSHTNATDSESGSIPE